MCFKQKMMKYVSVYLLTHIFKTKVITAVLFHYGVENVKLSLLLCLQISDDNVKN